MKGKIFWLSLAYTLVGYTTLIAQDITGYWKTINRKTGEAQSIVAVYKYQDKYYGRIVATFDSNGKVDETIYNPKTRAPGIQGNPYYCGLDFIWALRDKGSRNKGKIIDPQKGKVYDCESWVDDNHLVVRGELFIFGRNETWPQAEESDFPLGFKKKVDPKTFIPVRPEVN